MAEEPRHGIDVLGWLSKQPASLALFLGAALSTVALLASRQTFERKTETLVGLGIGIAICASIWLNSVYALTAKHVAVWHSHQRLTKGVLNLPRGELDFIRRMIGSQIRVMPLPQRNRFGDNLVGEGYLDIRSSDLFATEYEMPEFLWRKLTSEPLKSKLMANPSQEP